MGKIRMKNFFYIYLILSLLIFIFCSEVFSAGPEKIFGDYQSDLYEDAEAPVNQHYIDANTEALKKQGKVKEDVNSIGGIVIEEGATIFGPIGTSVDMHGGDITIINQKDK